MLTRNHFDLLATQLLYQIDDWKISLGDGMVAPVSAITLIALLLIAMGVWLRRFAQRGRYSLFQLPFVGVMYMLARLLWRVRVVRPLRLPYGQGAVLVCNHRSSLDPVMLHAGVDRMVHWMVAKEYADHRWFRYYLDTAQVISTRRSGVDTSATRQAIRLAEEGGLVGMFPEGRINMTDEKLFMPVRPGAAMIAIRANVPVIPCFIKGAPFAGTPLSPLRMTARVALHFGDPIYPSEINGKEDDNTTARELIRQAMLQVARMAGEEDYDVQLAGRKWRPSDEEVLEHVTAISTRRGNRDNGRR